MPDTRRLLDMVSVVGGGTPSRAEAAFWGGDIPWATVKDLTGPTLSSTVESISEAGLAASASNVAPAGAIILATRIVPGKAAVAGRPVAINQDLKALIPGESLDSRYLLYFFQSIAPLLQQKATGSTVKGITMDTLSRVRVPLLPVTEQRRIAAVLDKADGIRRKRQESLRLLDELLRSAFLEMFGNPVKNEMGWRTEKLRHIASVHGGLQVTSRRIVNNREVPYLRVANVQRGWIDLGEVKGLRVTDDEAKRARLEPGDVLVVEGHGNREEIGRSAVWEGTIVECVHQNHLIRVRPNTASVDPHFLSAFVNSASGRRQMLALGKTTSGLNTISTENVRQLVVAVPPLQLQQKYARLRALVEVAKSRFTTAGDVSSKLVASLQQTLLAESRGG